MSNSLDKNSLLQRLGGDWHAINPYIPLIESVVPNTKYALDIQDVLYGLYVDEHNNFKQSKGVSKDSLYSDEALFSEGKVKTLQEEMKKEEKILETLAKKFEEVQEYLVHTSNGSDDGEEEDDYMAAPQERGKGNMIKTKAKKLSPQEAAKILQEKKNVMIARSTKTAMATSQQKLLDFQHDIEKLEKKKTYYEHYHFALYGRQCGMKKLVLAYEKDRDIKALIQGIDELLTYYYIMRGRYVPSDKCEGDYNGLCGTHLLPFSKEVHCPLSPIA